MASSVCSFSCAMRKMRDLTKCWTISQRYALQQNVNVFLGPQPNAAKA